MKGRIFTQEKCPLCGLSFNWDEKKNGMFCFGPSESPHAQTSHFGKCRVYYGRKTSKRFPSVQEAARFLNTLRYKEEVEKSYDPRDYQKSNPLGFISLSERWLATKRPVPGKDGICPKYFRTLERAIRRAQEEWGHTNVKEIKYANLYDFLTAKTHISQRTGQPIKSKTLSDIHDAILLFFEWASDTEEFQKPKFPAKGEVKMEYRDTVTISEMIPILGEIKRLTVKEPKIWLFIHILSHNPNIRPGELLQITEGDVILEYGTIRVRKGKEGTMKAKYARLWEEEMELMKTFEPSEDQNELYFRRFTTYHHHKAGDPLTVGVGNYWVKMAIQNLGLQTRATLYSVTKHSGMVAASNEGGLSPEEIKRGGSEHKTDVIGRYLIPNKKDSDRYQQTLKELMQKEGPPRTPPPQTQPPDQDSKSDKIISLDRFRIRRAG